MSHLFDVRKRKATKRGPFYFLIRLVFGCLSRWRSRCKPRTAKTMHALAWVPPLLHPTLRLRTQNEPRKKNRACAIKSKADRGNASPQWIACLSTWPVLYDNQLSILLNQDLRRRRSWRDGLSFLFCQNGCRIYPATAFAGPVHSHAPRNECTGEVRQFRSASEGRSLRAARSAARPGSSAQIQ